VDLNREGEVVVEGVNVVFKAPISLFAGRGSTSMQNKRWGQGKGALPGYSEGWWVRGGRDVRGGGGKLGQLQVSTLYFV